MLSWEREFLPKSFAHLEELGLTILEEAPVVDGDLVTLPRLLGLLAVCLQGHLHLGQFYLKVSQFLLHLQPILSSINCLGFDQGQLQPAAHDCHHENPHHKSQITKL